LTIGWVDSQVVAHVKSGKIGEALHKASKGNTELRQWIIPLNSVTHRR